MLLLIIVSRIVNSRNRSRPSRSQRVPPGKPFPEEVYRVVPRPSVISEGKNLFSQYFPPIAGFPRCTQVIIVGVTFQSNCRFNRHVKNKLIKANKCVHILRTLRKECYNKSETNHLFKTLVLRNFLSVLAVNGASESDLSTVQGFLYPCFKVQFCSKHINVHNLLETQDRNIFKKVSNTVNHPLLPFLPRIKPTHYNLRSESFKKSKINTVRAISTYGNRLVFKYNLVLG